MLQLKSETHCWTKPKKQMNSQGCDCVCFKDKRILCDTGIICITITSIHVDVPILPWTSNQCKLYVIKFCETCYFPNIHSHANNESCRKITSKTEKKKNQDTKSDVHAVKTQQNSLVILDENNGLNNKQRGMFKQGKWQKQ